METYLTNFDFSKVVDYRIQPYYAGHRKTIWRQALYYWQTQ